jgi:lipopolysaccharide biosynthesis glycosyltransferase
MSERICICSAANHTYTMGLVVALYSALSHAPASNEPVRIYVLDGGIRDANWNRLEASLARTGISHELIRLKPDMARFAGLPQDWGSSVMTYARLALPEMVDEDRIFYVDSDIVVQRDWTSVWKTCLDGKIVGTSREVVIGTLGKEDLPLAAFGMDPDAPYLQAGVMLIDLPRWREERVSEQVLGYLAKYRCHSKHWDQSALNVVLYGKWHQLPDEWNVPAHWADQGRAGCTLDGALLHFAGPHKPWLYGYHRSGSAGRFFRALDQTDWCRWRPSAIRQGLKWMKYWGGRLLSRI